MVDLELWLHLGPVFVAVTIDLVAWVIERLVDVPAVEIDQTVDLVASLDVNSVQESVVVAFLK